MRPPNQKQANVRTNPKRINSITASPLGDLIAKSSRGYRNKVTREKYIAQKGWQLYSGSAEPPRPISRDMQDGIDREPIIKDLFSQLSGIEIADVEFEMHHSIPHFGASPDGRFAENAAVLVEVKHFRGGNQGQMVASKEIKEQHKVQMIAQIACFEHLGAVECEYIFANLDDEQGLCISNIEELKEAQIQSVRFKPTKSEVKAVLDEVEILVAECVHQRILIEKRSTPVNAN